MLETNLDDLIDPKECKSETNFLQSNVKTGSVIIGSEINDIRVSCNAAQNKNRKKGKHEAIKRGQATTSDFFNSKTCSPWEMNRIREADDKNVNGFLAIL